MNAFWKRATSGLAALLLLASCDDPNAANANNFERVLQRYYDTHPVCVSIAIELPLETAADIDDSTRHQLNALVKLGFLSVTAARMADLTPPGLGKVGGNVGYAPTAMGERFVRKGADDFIGGTDICFAHRRIMKIDSFTEPAELMGMKVVRVTYEYKLNDVAPWAKDGAIQDVFPQIKAMLARPDGTDVEGVVLTQDGWQLERAVH